MPLFSVPNRQPPDDLTTARCPVCDETALTVVVEFASSLFFRCESCGFIWLEDKPQVPDPPSNRAAD